MKPIPRNASRVAAVITLALLASASAWAGVGSKARKPDAASPLAAITPADSGMTGGAIVDAAPVINNSRMATYTWTAARSFAVRALSGMNTDVEVPAGEKIYGFYLSNATDWSFQVLKDQQRVLIKPAQPGLYNTALMVTNKRSYQLTLISVAPNALWFQRVEWRVPEVQPTSTNGGAYWTATDGHAAPATVSAAASTATGQASLAAINPASMYFSYDVSGRAAFKPTSVFDDGVRTWLRFPSGMQDMPAIFAITDGKLDVVDYSVADGYVIVPRVAAKFVLKLNGSEVTIKRGCNPERCLK